MSGSSFFRSLKAVAWSFLGIRKQAEHQQDMARANPLHIIVVGILGVVFLVAGLIALATWVVK